MKKHFLIEKNIIAILLLLLRAGLIAYGIHSGQMKSVFKKAARVCLECIGIG